MRLLHVSCHQYGPSGAPLSVFGAQTVVGTPCHLTILWWRQQHSSIESGLAEPCSEQYGQLVLVRYRTVPLTDRAPDESQAWLGLEDASARRPAPGWTCSRQTIEWFRCIFVFSCLFRLSKTKAFKFSFCGGVICGSPPRARSDRADDIAGQSTVNEQAA